MTDAPNVVTSMAVSPAGARVFVTGNSAKAGQEPREFATVAYRAATGARLWASPSPDGGYASALAVSPDGRRVYVAGHTAWAIPRTLAHRCTVIAYRA